MSIASKVRTGSLWLAGTRVLTNALGLVSMLVTARFLVPDDFGVVAIGLTIHTIVISVTELSLAQAIIHCDNPDDRHLNCAFTMNMLRGVILGLLFIASGPLIAAFYGDQRLIWIMAAIALSTLIASAENPRLAMLKRDIVFKQDFYLEVISKMAMIAVTTSVAILTRSYLALILAVVASALARQVASYFFIPHRPRLRLREYRELLDFSGWMTLSQIVQTLSWRLDPLIVGKFLGAFEVGLFTVASRLAHLTTREPIQPLTATLFPALRQLRDDPERLRAAFIRAQSLVTAAALATGVIMAILARPLVLLVMGEKWLPAVPIIQVLSITMSLQTMATIAQPLAMAAGKTKLLFRRSLEGLVFRLPIILTAIYLGGLQGYLIGRGILCVTGILFDMLVIKAVTGMKHRHQLLVHWRTLAAGGATLGVAFFAWPSFDFGTAFIPLFLSIATMGALSLTVYAATLFGLWFLARRPSGPEAELLDMLTAAVRRGGRFSLAKRA